MSATSRQCDGRRGVRAKPLKERRKYSLFLFDAVNRFAGFSLYGQTFGPDARIVARIMCGYAFVRVREWV